MKDGHILKLKDLKNISRISSLGKFNNSYSYWVKMIDDKEYIIDRFGNCDNKKCKAKCCKFIVSPCYNTYIKGFGKSKDGNVYTPVKCKYLCRNKCTKWKRLPEACKQFPHPSDPVYWECIDVCTFKFRVRIVCNDKPLLPREMKEE